MAINRDFINELEGNTATLEPSPKDYLVPAKQSNINRDFIDSLIAGEHQEVQDNKAAEVKQPPDNFWAEQAKQWEQPGDIQGTFGLPKVKRPAPPITAATPYSFPRFQPQSKLWEQTKKSWQRGGQAVDIDFLYSRVARGEIDEAQADAAEKKYMELIKADPIKARNWLENVYLKTVQMARPMAEGTLKGAKYGTAAAGAAVVAGQAGPQVALPEEIITAPVAFQAGQTVGSVKYWAEQGHGLIYREARKQGLTHETAQASAAVGGPLYAFIEYSQVDKIIPGKANYFERLSRSALIRPKKSGKKVSRE